MKYLTIRRYKNSGIALVTAMVITLVIMMLIGSLTYLLTRGFGSNVLNRQFTTAYDAANGGVEYGAGIVKSYIDTADISGLVPTAAIEASISNLIQNCSTTPETFTLNTADGNYTIDIEMVCLGTQVIPGMGGVLKFPPLPAITSGGSGTWYIFYSINAVAQETTTGIVARTESVYRAIQ